MITILGGTDIGLVRKSNQDRYAYKVLGEHLAYAVVCDGLGGLSCGHIASETATRYIEQTIERGLRPEMSGMTLKNLMASAAVGANALVYDEVVKNPEFAGMGTTMIIAVVQEGSVSISHVGDSRVYHLRGGQRSQLTKDHTVVQMLLERGRITQQEAEVHPERHIITRAIGAEASVDADFLEHPLEPGDMLLLCSDGLYNFIGKENLDGAALEAHLCASMEAGSVDNLIELAKEVGGGGDNITAVLLCYSHDSDSTEEVAQKMEHLDDKYLGKKLEGRYEIQELIGAGGMANVYKAFDVIDRRTVSVKILRDEFLGNAEFLRRFKNESKAIAMLSHQNIVQVYDVSFTNRVQSIVMEYIDGITLKDYIERQVTLSWKEAVHFTLQILRALTHAHEKGIVHRDIKPHNIMLLQNGAIKVTDFGIARFARSDVKTITDRAIGSVHYISPEQAMGDNTDQKSDIYSVGVMLFEMLTGKVPFEADSAVSVAIKHIQLQAERPTAINPDIPGGLEEITMRAMEKGAERRYQSAQAMIDDIERFKSDPSIHFQYKYLSTDNTQAERKKYRRAINQTREERPLQKPRRRKRVPYIPILAGVTFAFVVASLAFVWMMIQITDPFAQVEEVPVPNLVGLRFDTAISQYSGINVEIVQEREVYNDEFARGVIFAQEPRHGRSIREGTQIRVHVSSGQQILQLQNYVGQSLAMVRSALASHGLRYEVRHDYSNTVPQGHVILHNPSVGHEVRSGETIILYVSMGQDVVWRSVPNVVGMNLEQARQLLELSNMRVGDVTPQPSNEPAGTILAQSPLSATQQTEGTSINLVISREEEYRRVTIPVDMPQIDSYITVHAFADGEHITTDMLNPRDTPTWRPVLSGSHEVVVVDIVIDNFGQRRFYLDFAPASPTFHEITDGW